MTTKKTPKSPKTWTAYICFDLVKDYIDNICYEDELKEAKTYDFYLTILIPKDGSGNQSHNIGTVDLTIPKSNK
jgi:hypothetical protein